MATAKTKIEKLRDQLEADRKKVAAKSAPHRAKREQLLKKIQPLEDELRAVNQQIKKIEQPALGNIDVQIGALTKAMGGRALSDSEG